MQEKNSKKRNSILIVIGLVLLIAIVVITSIVLNFKKQKLEDMEDQNQQIEDVCLRKATKMLSVAKGKS